MFSKKFIVFMLVFIALLLIFVAGLLLWQRFNPSANQKNGNGLSTEQPSVVIPQDAKQATGDLVDQIKNSATEQSNSNQPVVSQVVNVPGVGEAVQAAPGSSVVAVNTGKVMTLDGQTANNSAAPGTIGAPLESSAVDPNSLPSSAIKLLVTDTSITPAQFTVHPGQAVLLSITAGPSWTEIFNFDNPSLSGVAVGVAPNETRSITFNAPTIPGEYVYFSAMSNHRAAGSIGKMIVK
jgi:FtsP/CotA-like multicopper oxidase with cupredoxin domain